MSDSEYIGSELEIFQHAVNWKRYYGSIIRPYLGSEVLEVGAGIGATTEALITGETTRWVCLEPDPTLVKVIEGKIAAQELPATCEARVGTTEDIGTEEKFDSVIYIDVLEHIEQDAQELKQALRVLKPSGHLIVLSPAHQFLFTPFDKAIGHFRRYSKSDLVRFSRELDVENVLILYLDSVGILASLANRLFLRSSMPTYAQIALWDTRLVPVSEAIDGVLGYRLGKSVVGIWKRNSSGEKSSV